MDPRDASVECAQHGPQEPTFVCQHLARAIRDRTRVGFFTSASPVPRPDAWCADCERAVQRTNGEWNDESEAFAGITLLCGACYDDVRALQT